MKASLDQLMQFKLAFLTHFDVVFLGLELASGTITSKLVSRVFIKGFRPYIVVKSVYLWENKVWGYLFWHLADVTLH